MRALIVIMISFALLPAFVVQQASAQDKSPFVACVQQALIDSGYDPRGVDSAIGKGTRAAAEKYAAEHPDLGLPELSMVTAQAWCTSIVATNPEALTRRVIIETELPDDYDVGFRYVGGKATEFALGEISSEAPLWDRVEIDGVSRRVARFPSGLLAAATFFCVDSQGAVPYLLKETTKEPSDHIGLKGIHHNYMGVCRWRGGKPIFANADLAKVEGNGDIVLRYRVAPL